MGSGRAAGRRRARVATTLCAIARDEDAYLAEWVAFHLRIGFDRIVLYDHESVRPIRAETLDGEGRVEVRPWPTRPGVAPQIAAYDHCLRQDRHATDWLMYLDLDEFLNLKAFDTVGAFARAYAEYTAVAVHWRFFGSAGCESYAPEPVTRRFLQASPVDWEPNRLVKTLFRPRTARGADVHVPHLRWSARMTDTARRPVGTAATGFSLAPATEAAQVNHYFTKSRGEFLAKCARGRADKASDSPERFRDEAVFALYDRNDERDDSILRHWG